jgi:hypothetical protein
MLRIGPRGGPPQTYQRVLGRTVQRGSDGQPHVYIYIYICVFVYTHMCIYSRIMHVCKFHVQMYI